MLGVIMGFDGFALGLAAVLVPMIVLFWLAHWWDKRHQHNKSFNAFIAAFVVLVFAIPVVVLITCATTGLHPTYALGVREGYITKIEIKGLIWKTCEVEVQIGTGKLAALQKPWKFSLDMEHEDDYVDLCENMGKRVLICYQEWLLMPYHVGSSGFGILKIVPRDVDGYPEGE